MSHLTSALTGLRRLLICIGLAGALTTPTYASVQALTPNAEHSDGIKEIIEVLNKKHYRDVELNNDFASLLLDRYLELLDPSKSYFYASDIARFEPWRTSFDESVAAGDLEHSFTIYNIFRTRFVERMEANIALLESDKRFDYELEESLPLALDEPNWLADRKAADDIWRKRIKDSLLRLLLSDKEPEAARELLVKRYKNRLSLVSEQSADDSFELFANAVAGIYDPHTSYLSPRALENFQISMSLSLEGIGAVLQREDEYTKVVRVVPGGPADKQGTLSPGDKIISVAQDKNGETVDVIGWRLDNVVDLIRGKKGTLVRLGVIQGKVELNDKIEEISIIRDEVKLESQAAKSEVIVIPAEASDSRDKATRLGLITLPAFYMDFEAYRQGDKNYKSTTRDVFKLLSELRDENVEGIILDLRNNGGGSLYEATSLTDLFIGPGPVVQIKHANRRVSRGQVARQQAMYNGPLLVLINRLSASASEIFAGVIQDYGRGLIVGSQSFGKGTVQVLTPLDRGQLKLTESKFYRVSGDSTQHRGVLPDIVFPSLYDVEEIGESSQEHALPWDRIHPAPHRQYPGVSQLLPDLQQRHKSRIASDLPWTIMLDELELIKRNRETKEISLNRKRRTELKNERESALMALENKRRKAEGSEVYENIEAWREANDTEAESLAEESEEDTLFNPAQDPQLKESSYILRDYIKLTQDLDWRRQMAASRNK